MIESYMGPTHRFAGSDTERQSVGLPGHCVACAEHGHVRAHPDLGCGDVGCNIAHDEEADQAASAEKDAGLRERLEERVNLPMTEWVHVDELNDMLAQTRDLPPGRTDG